MQRERVSSRLRSALRRAPLATRPAARSGGFKVWDKSDLAKMREQFAANGGDADVGAGADAEL